jgi:general secretion pathway protein L
MIYAEYATRVPIAGKKQCSRADQHWKRQKPVSAAMSPSQNSPPSVTRFFVWWGQELVGLLPSSLMRSDLKSPPRIMVGIEKDGFRLLDQRPLIRETGDDQGLRVRDLPALLAILSGPTKKGAATTIGLRLPFSSCYARQVELPPASPTQTAQMLALDLERNSPFKAADIWTAHLAQPELTSTAKQPIQHLIIKRAETSAIIASLAAQNITVVWLDCWNAQGAAPLPVNFLAANFAPAPVTRRAKAQLFALIATALLLSASAAYLWIDQHETALATLKRDTAQLKAKAQSARDARAKSKIQFDEFAALQKLHDDYSSKTLVLNELTILLPDTAWVSDLKIEGANLELTGLAQSAANVVRILERSSTFSDVSLASAVTFDQRNNQERFSLRLRLRGALDATGGKSKEQPE